MSGIQRTEAAHEEVHANGRDIARMLAAGLVAIVAAAVSVVMSAPMIAHGPQLGPSTERARSLERAMIPAAALQDPQTAEKR